MRRSRYARRCGKPTRNQIVGIRRWQAIRDVLGAELIASASGRYLSTLVCSP